MCRPSVVSVSGSGMSAIRPTGTVLTPPLAPPLRLHTAANKRLGRIARRVSKVVKDMRPIQAIKSLAAKVPAIKVPTIKVPAIKVPRIKVPRIKVPRIKVPRMKVPTIKIPAIKVPAMKIRAIKSKRGKVVETAAPVVETAAPVETTVAPPAKAAPWPGWTWKSMIPRAKVAQGEKKKVARGGGKKKKVAARIAAAFTSCFSRRAVVAEEEEEEYSLRLSVDSDESDGEMISVGNYPANSETTTSLTAPAEAANSEMVEMVERTNTSWTDEWFNQDLSQLSDLQLLAVFEMAVAHDIEPEVRPRTYADAAHGVPVHPRWSALRC